MQNNLTAFRSSWTNAKRRIPNQDVFTFIFTGLNLKLLPNPALDNYGQLYICLRKLIMESVKSFSEITPDMKCAKVHFFYFNDLPKQYLRNVFFGESAGRLLISQCLNPIVAKKYHVILFLLALQTLALIEAHNIAAPGHAPLIPTHLISKLITATVNLIPQVVTTLADVDITWLQFIKVSVTAEEFKVFKGLLFEDKLIERHLRDILINHRPWRILTSKQFKEGRELSVTPAALDLIIKDAENPAPSQLTTTPPTTQSQAITPRPKAPTTTFTADSTPQASPNTAIVTASSFKELEIKIALMTSTLDSVAIIMKEIVEYIRTKDQTFEPRVTEYLTESGKTIKKLQEQMDVQSATLESLGDSRVTISSSASTPLPSHGVDRLRRLLSEANKVVEEFDTHDNSPQSLSSIDSDPPGSYKSAFAESKDDGRPTSPTPSDRRIPRGPPTPPDQSHWAHTKNGEWYGKQEGDISDDDSEISL